MQQQNQRSVFDLIKMFDNIANSNNESFNKKNEITIGDHTASKSINQPTKQVRKKTQDFARSENFMFKTQSFSEPRDIYLQRSQIQSYEVYKMNSPTPEPINMKGLIEKFEANIAENNEAKRNDLKVNLDSEKVDGPGEKSDKSSQNITTDIETSISEKVNNQTIPLCEDIIDQEEEPLQTINDLDLEKANDYEAQHKTEYEVLYKTEDELECKTKEDEMVIKENSDIVSEPSDEGEVKQSEIIKPSSLSMPSDSNENISDDPKSLNISEETVNDPEEAVETSSGLNHEIDNVGENVDENEEIEKEEDQRKDLESLNEEDKSDMPSENLNLPSENLNLPSENIQEDNKHCDDETVEREFKEVIDRSEKHLNNDTGINEAVEIQDEIVDEKLENKDVPTEFEQDMPENSEVEYDKEIILSQLEQFENKIENKNEENLQNNDDIPMNDIKPKKVYISDETAPFKKTTDISDLKFQEIHSKSVETFRKFKIEKDFLDNLLSFFTCGPCCGTISENINPVNPKVYSLVEYIEQNCATAPHLFRAPCNGDNYKNLIKMINSGDDIDFEKFTPVENVAALKMYIREELDGFLSREMTTIIFESLLKLGDDGEEIIKNDGKLTIAKDRLLLLSKILNLFVKIHENYYKTGCRYEDLVGIIAPYFFPISSNKGVSNDDLLKATRLICDPFNLSDVNDILSNE